MMGEVGDSMPDLKLPLLDPEPPPLDYLLPANPLFEFLSSSLSPYAGF
jgi:hypothetical protein